MASIPQQQVTDAYHQVKYADFGEVYFGRAYRLSKIKNKFRLVHYGTMIYECDIKNRTFSVGGYSKSDVDAINSIAYWTGIGGAYIQDYTLWPIGKGPRYEKKNKRRN